MPEISTLKRLLVGRPLRTQEVAETSLRKRIALPIFSSDALSSVAYATEEILKTLTLGALAFLYLTPWVAACVVLLMGIVVVSYRQVVHAYPGGGGSYEVVRTNLGRLAGMVVAASLMVDYVLTVSVSIASGVDNVISAFPHFNEWRVGLAVGFVVLLALMNLRGVRESGRAFAIPTYLFILGIFTMIAVGFVRVLAGSAPVAESAHFEIRSAQEFQGLGVLFLALRAFSSGCTALTGVEAISNGVPSFRAPKARNAARTLLAMGTIAVAMFAGITALAVMARVRVAEHACDLIGFPGNCAVDPQRTVVAQLAAAVFGGHDNLFFYYIQATTALVLVLAANTAFNGFPMLTSILAQHSLMPRQLRTRGDRLAFSNGIVFLAAAAIGLLVLYQASVTRLIQLYILGVFTSFTLSQIGMVRHWTQQLAGVRSPDVRRHIQLSRVINTTGALLTGLVLVIVLITKFTHGAYLVVIAVPVLCLVMNGISRHYAKVSDELALHDDPRLLPSRVHAVVLVAAVHEPTARALSYARATRPSTLTALTVNIDAAETERLVRSWDATAMPVPLTVADSPYRELTGPIVDYVRSIRRSSPRDLVTVFVPEYVVKHWWQEFLHNQSALILKMRLRLVPGVMVTSVPYLLAGVQQATPATPSSPASPTPPERVPPAARARSGRIPAGR